MTPSANRPALAILISGRGSNMSAIAKACANGQSDARIVCVLADRSDAAGIAIAARSGLPTQVLPAAQYADRSAFEAALAAAIDASGATLVVLAGFMRILSASWVRRFEGRILNIHPSLLPRHKGLHTHRQALAAGDNEHGASVHFVSPELDAGPSSARRASRCWRRTPKLRWPRACSRWNTASIPKPSAGLVPVAFSFGATRSLFDGRRLDAPLEA